MPDDPFVIGSNRKIDPYRRRISQLDLLPDGSPNDYDRVEIGPTDLAFEEWAALGLEVPNLARMREYRLKRLVDHVNERGYAGVLMYDPLNIRYATDTTNMQVWVTHNMCRACLVLADGYTVLWDFHSCDHLSAHLPLVNELRHGADVFYFDAGDRGEERAKGLAADIADLVRAHAGENKRLAVDKAELAMIWALEGEGFELKLGQELTEHARKVKSADELNAMRCAIASCEAAMRSMQDMVRPGMTEVDAWAELNRASHVRGGEWIETRILASGPRTNPWFQECGPRVMKEGDILAYDTDMVGPYGFCADLSRTFKIGGGRPTDNEREAYQIGYEHIMTNRELIKPGASFQELMEGGHRLPEAYRDLRYGVKFHGVGLCDEFPAIFYPEDWDAVGYHGELEPGMCLCVEVYAGKVGGGVGIKLEDQVVVTETGYENLTSYPFEEELLR
jgi:Xaa-Pro aminopeptidase